MKLRILHATDTHARKDRAQEVFAGFDALEADARANGCDLFAFSGDFWDSAILNTAGSMIMQFVDRVRRLADIAPIVLVEGTPTHDAPGSIDIFEQIQAEHPIVILRPGKAYALLARAIVPIEESLVPPKALLLGVPEPNKKWLLAEAGATGKEASDKEVRDRLRALFLGLGGLRRQHEDLPCILLYHGEVAGAKAAAGYKSEASTGLVVTRDDLAAVGADYIALGHIHEPQQIPSIPAYYAGSMYPKDFGETHKAGANIVTIEDLPDYDLLSAFTVNVSRLDFGIPQRVSIKADSWSGLNVQGLTVSFEPKMAAEEYANFDIEAETAKLIAAGALPGSRVLPKVEAVETVRAAEIVEKTRARDKVTVYAESSALSCPESVLLKADEIEREDQGTAVMGASGHVIRIDSLRLRGAKGIWKNQRRDEIYIDLTRYDPGVIAVVGKNGAGKTTIIENMHPWPQLLTRSGTMKSHFRLRNSCRELCFTDSSTGWHYRALIEINAATASGGAEYWLHVDKGQGFEPMSGITGRLAEYETAIGELFGSLEMYLRTAFVTQSPTDCAPDLARATKGQRKALFAELSGIDYLERYKLAAKARADRLDAEIIDLSARVETAQAVAASLPEKRAEREEMTKQKDQAASSMRSLEAEGAAARDKVAQAEDELAKAKTAFEMAERAAADIKTARDGIEQTRRDISGYREAVEKRPAAEKAIAEARDLQAKRDKLLAEKSAVDLKNHVALVAYQDTTREIRAKQDQARAKLDAERATLSRLERNAAVIASGVAAEIELHCPTCGQLLPEETRTKLIADQDRARQKAKEATEAVLTQQKIVNAAADAMRAIVMPEAPATLTYEREAELRGIEFDLDMAEGEAQSASTVLSQAGIAEVRIEEAQRRIAEKEQTIASLAPIAASFDNAKASFNDAFIAEEKAKKLYEDIKASYSSSRAAQAAAEASLSMLDRAIAEGEKVTASAEKLSGEMGAKNSERAEWRFLEKAFGPDGIQALELDALAPSIATVTNRLLAASYGDRYTVRFDTTKESGRGSKAKQIEDFLIFIHDAETGEEQEIGTLSGGESVWLRKALYDAFAIIRARNKGIMFETVFLDEADGALDPASRAQYLTMLMAAHEESRRRHTLIITHSAELQAMIGQSLDVATLAPKEASL